MSTEKKLNNEEQLNKKVEEAIAEIKPNTDNEENLNAFRALIKSTLQNGSLEYPEVVRCVNRVFSKQVQFTRFKKFLKNNQITSMVYAGEPEDAEYGPLLTRVLNRLKGVRAFSTFCGMVHINTDDRFHGMYRWPEIAFLDIYGTRAWLDDKEGKLTLYRPR